VRSGDPCCAITLRRINDISTSKTILFIVKSTEPTLAIFRKINLQEYFESKGNKLNESYDRYQAG